MNDALSSRQIGQFFIRSDLFYFIQIDILEIEHKYKINRKKRDQAKRMNREDDTAIKELAREKAKEKARKKRADEKINNIYKQTNIAYQKKINSTRKDYGLEKQKIQKPLSGFFKQQ